MCASKTVHYGCVYLQVFVMLLMPYIVLPLFWQKFHSTTAWNSCHIIAYNALSIWLWLCTKTHRARAYHEYHIKTHYVRLFNPRIHLEWTLLTNHILWFFLSNFCFSSSPAPYSRKKREKKKKTTYNSKNERILQTNAIHSVWQK